MATTARVWAAYRIAFVLTGYHLLLLVGTMCCGRFAAILHHGYWLAKLLFLASVATGTLFAPNHLFAYYAWIARIGAPVFLLYQLIISPTVATRSTQSRC